MRFQFPRWPSVKTKVTLFTLVIFVIGIWSLALYASRMLRESMEGLLRDQQYSTISLLATGINQALDDRIGALEAVARNVSSATLGNPADLQTFLERLTLLQRLFNGGVIAIRLDGTAIVEVPRAAGRIGINYMDIDAVAATLRNGKTTISQPLVGKKLQAPVFGMTVPIHDAQGKVIGALSGVINLGKPNFLDQITQGRYGRTGGYTLVARQNRLIVTASDKSRIMKVLPPLDIDPMINRFFEGYEGSGVLVNPFGVEVLASAKSIPLADWYVTVGLPTEEAFAPIRDVQRRMLGVALFLTLLTGGLTWWMLRRQLEPLLVTAKELAAMTEADHPPRPLQVTTRDEIGQLIGAFNRLLETLRKQEATLHENTERLNEAQHLARVGSWTLDLVTCKLIWSDEALRLLEIDPMRFGDAYEAFLNAIHPDDRAAVKQAFSDSIENDRPYEITYRLCMSDGRVKWICEKCALTFDAAGKPLRHSGTVQDITERKQAEAAARLAEHSIVIGTSPIAIAIARVEDGRFVEVNDALLRLFGREREKMLGRTSREIGYWSSANAYSQFLEKLQSERELSGYEVSLCDAGGTPRNILMTCSFIEFGGQPCIISFLQDITERKQSEKRMEELSQHMVVVQESARRRLSGELHDRTSPNLAAIGVNLDIITATMLEGQSPSLSERLADIRALIEDTTASIREICSDLRPPILDYAGLAAALESYVRQYQRRTSIAVRLGCADPAERLPPALESVLFRIVQEALTNCAKHSRAKSIDVTLKLDDAPVVLTISDDGIGFDPDALGKTTHTGGLGILTMREMAEFFGGQFILESVPGKGTRIRLEICPVEKLA